jgi:tRNA(Ile)-lysidine synthase
VWRISTGKVTYNSFTLLCSNLNLFHIVTQHLKKRTLQSPIGTFLLSAHNLSEITDEAVRKALVLRIMRYVSFNPWGSMRAEGNRRRASIQQIVDKLWHPNPLESRIGRFVAGSGVLWEYVVSTRPNGRVIRVRAGRVPEGAVGWLASRMAQTRQMPQGEENPLIRDVTSLLSQPSKTEVVDVLYDCRFLVRFNVAKMPTDITATITSTGHHSRIVILADTIWLWPKVWWMKTWEDPVALASVDEQLEAEGREEDSSSWIHFEWIRSLDAT